MNIVPGVSLMVVAAALAATPVLAQVPEGEASAVCETRSRTGSVLSPTRITINPSRGIIIHAGQRFRFLGNHAGRIVGDLERGPRSWGLEVYYRLNDQGELEITRFAQTQPIGGPIERLGSCTPA